MGRMYTVSFENVAVAAAQDFFQIEAVNVPAIIHHIELSQGSDLGDAESEGLRLRIRRVTDALTNVTAEQQLDTGDSAANADLNVNDTTVLATGAANLYTFQWNILTPFIFLPTPESRIVVPVGDVVTVNLAAAPTDSVTMSGFMVFEEIGA